MIGRGDVRWSDLSAPVGSEPGFRRPVVIISADAFNQSRINTVVAATVSSNLGLADAPGNVEVASEASGLEADSVINVSQIVTLDKGQVGDWVATLGADTMARVEAGLVLIFDLA